MEVFEFQSLLLKILAVLYVILTISIASKKKILAAILFIAASSTILHAIMDGLAGAYFSAAGIAVSLLLTLPMRFTSEYGKSKFIYSAAAGAITGPIGSIALYLIVYVFFGIRMLYKFKPLPIHMYQQMAGSYSHEAEDDSGIKSQLARIEMARFDRERDYPSRPAEEEREDQSRIAMEGCWPMIVGISTLAVLISGIIV